MNGILLTVVGLAVRSVSLAFNSFVTKSIGAEGIGLFTLISTVYSFAVTFATSGISLTVTRLVSSAVGEGRENDVDGILRSALFYAALFGCGATCVLLFGAELFGSLLLSDSRTVIPLRILSLSLVPIALSSVFNGYFVGVKRVGRNAVIQVAGQIFRIAVTVVFVFGVAVRGVESGVTALCISISVTECAVFLVALLQFVAERRGGRKKRRTCGHFNAVVGTALPLAISAYIRSALLTLEHILIPKRLRDRGESNSEALASYGVLHGMALPMLLYPMAPLTSFSGLLVPEFSESMARGEKRRMERLTGEALNATLAYSVAAMLIIALFSEELGYAVYGSYDAGRYIAVMAPVLPIMYLDHVTDSILKGIGEHVYSMWVNISDSLISVLLVWVLIARVGIAGYAVVIVVMEGYNFILSVIRLRAKIKFKISPAKAFFIPFLAAAVAAALSKRLFGDCGSFTPRVWLFLEILFTVCAFVAVRLSVTLAAERFGLKKRR